MIFIVDEDFEREDFLGDDHVHGYDDDEDEEEEPMETEEVSLLSLTHLIGTKLFVQRDDGGLFEGHFKEGRIFQLTSSSMINLPILML